MVMVAVVNTFDCASRIVLIYIWWWLWLVHLAVLVESIKFRFRSNNRNAVDRGLLPYHRGFGFIVAARRLRRAAFRSQAIRARHNWRNRKNTLVSYA